MQRYIDGGYRKFIGRTAPFWRGRAAMRHAVGGNFDAFGAVERDMLLHYGLQPEHSVVDVGCGPGRLALALREVHPGPYLGTEVVGSLLREARRVAARPGWRFAEVDGLTIPAPDQSADFVCFFSVLTHLLHEHAYLYLEEARRVLKPGGRIVFSFLEFRCEPHRAIFTASVDGVRNDRPGTLNTFLSREALGAWSEALGLELVDVRDGHQRFVPLRAPVRLESGEEMRGMGCLGQSIGVLAKPPARS